MHKYNIYDKQIDFLLSVFAGTQNRFFLTIL